MRLPMLEFLIVRHGFALFLGQPMLGFEDPDDPALGVRFVRAYPEAFTGTGTMLIPRVVPAAGDRVGYPRSSDGRCQRLDLASAR